MATEKGATGEGGTGKDLADALVSAFKNLRIQSLPTVGKLSKFSGRPSKPGEPSLREWLDEVDIYSRQLNLSDNDKASTVFDHLTGSAREEVLCAGEYVRSSFTEIEKILKKRFGPQDTLNSLHGEFFRMEQADDSLCEFTLSLLRIYNRMVGAAETKEDSDALKRLKDTSLTQQLITGTNSDAVRREVRRMVNEKPAITFEQVRDKILQLFPDNESSKPSKAKVRGIQGEDDMLPSRPDTMSLLNKLIKRQEEFEKEVRHLLSGASAERPKKGVNGPCFSCGTIGHFKRNCPYRDSGRPDRSAGHGRRSPPPHSRWYHSGAHVNPPDAMLGPPPFRAQLPPQQRNYGYYQQPGPLLTTQAQMTYQENTGQLDGSVPAFQPHASGINTDSLWARGQVPPEVVSTNEEWVKSKSGVSEIVNSSANTENFPSN
jgi:hypothetical protein